MNRRLSCALALLVLCVVLTAIGVLLQMLNFVPDQAERTQTAQTLDLPTRIAVANATRRVELTATILARPTATLTVSPTDVPSDTPSPTNTSEPTERPIPTNVPLPTATPAFDEQAYIESLDTGLFILAGGRSISSIRVADGRPEGGERVAIIAYASSESTGEAMVSEMFDILSAIGATIDAQSLDIDSVALSIGNAAGEATAIVDVSVENIQLWRNGQLTDSQFADRINMTDF